jgi:hypothetical protein
LVRRQCWATPALAMIDQQPRCVNRTDLAVALRPSWGERAANRASSRPDIGRTTRTRH